MFVIYLPAVGGEEGPGELEQCITQPRQPTALNKTRLSFNQPGVALLSQSGHLSPPQFTLELLFAADVQEPLPCDDGQAQPTRDNAAMRMLSPLPTSCLFWKDPQQVREIWSNVVDPLFPTKTALLGKKNPKPKGRGRMWCKDLFHHTRGTPFPQGTLRDSPARGFSPEPRAAQKAAPPELLQVLGGFSRDKVISCLKQLTNLHRNWRTLRVSRVDAAKSCGGRQPKFMEQSASKGGNWWCLLMEVEQRGTGTSPRFVVPSLLRPTQSWNFFWGELSCPPLCPPSP